MTSLIVFCITQGYPKHDMLFHYPMALDPREGIDHDRDDINESKVQTDE